jgi:hypothetical protein
MPLRISLFQHTKNYVVTSIIHNSIAMFSQQTLYPGGIRTLGLLFLMWSRCPLRHAARVSRQAN